MIKSSTGATTDCSHTDHLQPGEAVVIERMERAPLRGSHQMRYHMIMYAGIVLRPNASFGDFVDVYVPKLNRLIAVHHLKAFPLGTDMARIRNGE